MKLQRFVSSVALASTLAGCQWVVGIEEVGIGEHDAGTGRDARSDANEPMAFVVRGTATGVLTPVSLRLEYTGGTELLSITDDGSFAFMTELSPGSSYTVGFVTDPGCILENQAGVVQGADPQVSLVCESVLLSGLTLSGPIPPVFDFKPGQSSYTLEVSLLQQSVRVTATAATTQSSIMVAGLTVQSGTPSEPLPLNLGDNTIEIVVRNGSGAAHTYRLTVRRAAMVAQYVYGKASNTDALDSFGTSVAISGDTLAVGAYGESSAATGVNGDQEDDNAEGSGAVYVFRHTGSSWAQEAYIKASNTEAFDSFGASLALSGDTLAVGAYGEASAARGVNGNEDDNTAPTSGAVYVFRRTGSSWTQEAYLKALNTDANDLFGWSVALSGDTLAVGAYGEDSQATGVNGNDGDNSAASSGAVYMFRRTGSSWLPDAYIKVSNTGAGDEFGRSVALSGDTLAVGAHSEDSADGTESDNSAANSGAVYVFRKLSSAWSQETYIKASNIDAGDRFGWSIALDGDVLAVGAYNEASSSTGVDMDQADNSAAESGAAYVFRRAGSSWSLDAYLKASNTGGGDRFGWSVALSNDVLAVGASLEDSMAVGLDGDQGNDGAQGSGAVYLFRCIDSSWTQAAYIKASNTDASDVFGYSVALSDDTLVAGAGGESGPATGIGGDQDADGATGSGAIYVFH